jgi:glycosyltransferase involved in cell wall biosynthesis
VGRFERIYFLTPSFNPAGGIVKIFDYLNHARALGYEAVVCCPEPYDASSPLFENSRYAHISPENGIRFVGLDRFTVGPADLCFFSWPPHYETVAPRISRWARPEQAIHIVQGTRHANPSFAGGYPLRLLTRPMARVLTNTVVLDAVEPHLNPSSLTEVIDLGHDTSFFRKERSGPLGSPLKVGYTTWKSKVGDEVAALLEGGGEFKFRAIRETAAWEELRDLYHWADAFLATPLAEEGFYMPALEAMAAGCVVLTPDAGGNMSYCEFGGNCLQVRLDDAGSYVEALKRLRAWNDSVGLDRLRREGYETAGRHTLEREGQRFGAFLGRLSERLQSPGLRLA